jgi:hypothetical protein
VSFLRRTKQHVRARFRGRPPSLHMLHARCTSLHAANVISLPITPTCGVKSEGNMKLYKHDL